LAWDENKLFFQFSDKRGLEYMFVDSGRYPSEWGFQKGSNITDVRDALAGRELTVADGGDRPRATLKTGDPQGAVVMNLTNGGESLAGPVDMSAPTFIPCVE